MKATPRETDADTIAGFLDDNFLDGKRSDGSNPTRSIASFRVPLTVGELPYVKVKGILFYYLIY